MNADDPLLKILACPLDKGPLHLLVPDEALTSEDLTSEKLTSEKLTSEEALYNPRLHRRYPIVDGIPQLLPSSGKQVTEDEHEELLKRMAP
ncbi:MULTISPECIES: Trm112 family protein [unclassified Streptomyces]|uniref:Trm112 family protein n=1 Tax=unclassified Streptomyces TaxID=2593676 RepID=UPI002E80D420|nr:Trm112 family protein [Streptomyces sp. NBC_00589]WTI39449.1 Trm112 family protein [Streptomyces sp. NBC_00775]WUB26873.1 Trm112 family protein [Streptomyces sp. NBC_00589]